MKLGDKLKEHSKEITDIMILSTLNGLAQHMVEIVQELHFDDDKEHLLIILSKFQEKVVERHEALMNLEVNEE